MQVQFGRTLGIAVICFGLLLLSVQLWLWSHTIDPPPSLAAESSPPSAAPNHQTTWFPGILGSLSLVGGIFLFSRNLLKPEDQPVQPGDRV
jgi:hypothetical protein